MTYRPIKLSGWNQPDSTVENLIDVVEKYLADFMETRAFDSGVRLADVEAYLQGVKDARKLMKKSTKTDKQNEI